jgi:hypothetical protein
VGNVRAVSGDKDTRAAELEEALLECEQRLARIGELELELREMSLRNEHLARRLVHRSPLKLARKAAGRLRPRNRP